VKRAGLVDAMGRELDELVQRVERVRDTGSSG